MKSQFGEPWRIEGDVEPRIMADDPKLCYTICGGPSDDANIPSIEQMRRIVACVNFCAGLPTELLSLKCGDPQFVNGNPASLSFPMTPLKYRPSFCMKLE
jgi:hypothetical protein